MVNVYMKRWFLIVMAMLCFAGTAQAVDEVSAAKDLTTVITLLGLPCGKVVSVVKNGKDDNLATCQDGNRYRVYLNAEGRVVAEKK